MIAKSVKGKGFRGALEYDLTKEQGRILDTNMAGSTPRELAAEFGRDPETAAAPGQGGAARLAVGGARGEADRFPVARDRVSVSRRHGAGRQPVRDDAPHRHRARAHPHRRQPHPVRRQRDERQPRLAAPGRRDAGDRARLRAAGGGTEPGGDAACADQGRDRADGAHGRGVDAIAAAATGRRGDRGVSQLHGVPGAAGGRRGRAGAGGAARRREALGALLPARRRDDEGQRPGPGLQPGGAGQARSDV